MINSVNNYLNEFVLYLAKYKTMSIVAYSVVFQIAMMHIISIFIFSGSQEGFKYRSISEHFVAAVIVAPILETYIFQKGIINFALLNFKTTKLVAILLSATGFGLIHTYSISYVVVTFFIGILYGIFYLCFVEKKVDAFWYLTGIHALYNLYAFVLNTFFLNHV
ncbi:MAG: CPBP family intramembrane metalloprotease [Chitinophagaceae bacterium]|nr:MAG: CPBP family intramembrane metalloprotease [Chitinophagaceae bacterium]